MVQLLNFDIPNIYLGGAGGIVLIVLLWWIVFRKQSGRLGEERQEENQTERLEQDEKQAEKAERDEKKVCAKMEKLVNGINEVLKKNGMGGIYDGLLQQTGSIKVMLWRMRDEKMSLERAIETFKALHANLNQFIEKLPKDNKTINGLVSQLLYYQKREYADLIKELQMDRDKKATLKKLWNEVTDEQSGSGTANAA